MKAILVYGSENENPIMPLARTDLEEQSVEHVEEILSAHRIMKLAEA